MTVTQHSWLSLPSSDGGRPVLSAHILHLFSCFTAKEAEEETTSTELASGDSAVDPPIDDTGAGGKDGDTGSENSQPSDFEVIQDSEITS
ncbi:hypothetical protein EB796_007439 [Bugula neritina]|uniref:Uncharacterized protein n=1 Tax=Bugula neritina TaxID=10212 RepID=A0A7J7K9H3_BUGNE|nr:hypothetical protein EB796_007439 [Bugula neritina]